MMRITEENEKVVTIEASGKLTKEDYDRVLPSLREKIRQEGVINALIMMENFDGMSFDALKEEASFDAKNLDNFKKVAVVSDSNVAQVGELFAKLFDVEVKQFDAGQSASARQWLTSMS